DPGQNVGPVFLADRVQYRRGELLAMPGAAARVRQEHQETLGREPVGEGPRVAKRVGPAAVGSAVDRDAGRQRPIGGALAGRPEDDAIQPEPATLPGDDLLWPELDAVEVVVQVAELLECIGRSAGQIDAVDVERA